MLEFPRWKYVLVALVMLLALMFALPNFFGTDPALQVARKNRLPMDEFARQAVEQTLSASCGGIPRFLPRRRQDDPALCERRRPAQGA